MSLGIVRRKLDLSYVIAFNYFYSNISCNLFFNIFIFIMYIIRLVEFQNGKYFIPVRFRNMSLQLSIFGVCAQLCS